VNAHGKAFLQDYLPQGVSLEEVSKVKAHHWPVSCRDAAIHLDRAIKGEVLKGNATPQDGVFLDLAGAPRGFEPELFEPFMRSRGIDVRTDLVQVQVHHHTSNGGIRIDSDAQTNITGLFAAGEAAGWQGADRLGGTMLSGSQVFGWRAGSKAAQVAGSRPSGPVSSRAVEPTAERIAKFSGVRGGQRPMDLRRQLQRVMWETLIVEKDAETLLRAKQCVANHRELLAKQLQIAEPADLALAFEQRNLLDVADAIVAAATMRTESRGSHCRQDYPQRNDSEWLTNIFITGTNGSLSLRKQWVAGEAGWIDQPGDVRIKPWG
jgi:fumarate reductase (CoM/CoB) subunit A